MAGFALTFGGTTGLALRSAAEMSISNPPADSAFGSPGGYRPWGADVDAMLFLGGLGGGATVFSRSLSPYVFAGLGMTGGDSAGTNVVRQGWSYGVGAAIPLGMHADVFGEARWRMSEYVLPTSEGAPDSKSAMRFGLSFHVGGGSNLPAVPRRGRHRMETAERGADDVEYVVTPAQSAPQVVVVQPAPPPEPHVVVIEQQPHAEQVVIVEPAPVPEQVIVPSEPAHRQSTMVRRGARSRPTTVVVSPRDESVATPVRTRPTARARVGGPTRVTTQPSSGSSSTVRTTTPSRVRGSAPAPTRTRATTPTTVRSRAGASPARSPAVVKAAPKTQARPQAATKKAAAATATKRTTSTRTAREPQD